MTGIPFSMSGSNLEDWWSDVCVEDDRLLGSVIVSCPADESTFSGSADMTVMLCLNLRLGSLQIC